MQQRKNSLRGPWLFKSFCVERSELLSPIEIVIGQSSGILMGRKRRDNETLARF
jgi:hypothetical protein